MDFRTMTFDMTTIAIPANKSALFIAFRVYDNWQYNLVNVFLALRSNYVCIGFETRLPTFAAISQYAFRYSVLHNLNQSGTSHCICCMLQVCQCHHALLKCVTLMMTGTTTSLKPW